MKPRRWAAGELSNLVVPALAILALYLMSAGPRKVQGADTRALPLHRASFGVETRDQSGFYRMAVAVGDDYFDGASDPSRVRRHMQTARTAGVRYLRCAFSWNGIEKAPGQYDWRFWDMLVSTAGEYGVELMPYVAYTPEWAAAKKEEFWKQPPRETAEYARFMKTAAARYKGRIHSWEIWNEPDLAEYWQGSGERFAELVKQAAVAIRQADPDAVIVLGGISRSHDPFLRELITRHHVDRYVDVVAMHGYPESWLPERMETVYGDWVRELRRMLDQSGSGVDLWLNEMGYPDWRYAPDKASIYGSPVFYRYEHTRDYGAPALFKAEMLALASGEVSLTMWYRLDDFCGADFSGDAVNYHLGLLDCGGKPKPALRALRHFTRLFSQPVRPATVSFTSSAGKGSQAVVEAVERKDGHVVVSAWLRSSEASEIPRPTGLLSDARLESLTVTLPCRAAGAAFTDSTGRPVKNATVAGDRLTYARVRGREVAVADVTCVTGGSDKIPLTAGAPPATLKR